MKSVKYTYNLREDTLMIEIVKESKIGNPGNLSFWIKAKNEFDGLERHSAESLKKHWVYLIEKKKILELNPSINLNKKNFSTRKKRVANPSKEKIKQDNNYKVKGEGQIKQELKFELNSEDKFDGGKMSYSNWILGDQNCEEFPKKGLGSEEICKFFDELVEACKKRAGFNVEPELVVRVLDMYGGVAEKTIKYFEHKYHYVS